MTIGIYARDFAEWAGGLDILRLVTAALTNGENRLQADLRVLVPLEQCQSRTRPHYAFSPQDIRDFFPDLSDGETLVFYEEEEFLTTLERNEVDVLIPVHTLPSPPLPIPWVGYVYDFQHRYIPEHYTPEERCRRDALFAGVLNGTGAVIVNSRTVLGDINRFFPERRARVFALPFCPVARPDWFSAAPQRLAQHSVPRRFFAVCNQFWIHKEHRTVFRAYAQIQDEARERGVGLICTGRMEDRRFIPPEHIASLRRELNALGIAGDTHLLGHIPKRDQVEIVKSSEALIQPTLFEGGPGGGAVYDAISLGVPCILSDIPVNREVEGDSLYYFTPKCADELAERMHRILNHPPARPSISQLTQTQKRRMAKLHQCLMEAIAEVRQRRREDATSPD